MSRDTMMRAVLATNPNFTQKRSSLRGVLDAYDAGGSGMAAKMQEALDELDVKDAERYKNALQILMDDNPTLFYVSVTRFDPTSTPPSAPAMYNGAHDKMRYTSAKFVLNASAYCITPASMACEIGFIQQCTAKNDQANYSDGSAMRDHNRLGYPVGDSSGDLSAPFYHKGVSHGCAQPAWVDLSRKPAQSVALEVNDDFINNFHFGKPKPAVGTAPATSVLRSIDRKQSFTCWLAFRRPAGIRLLREVKYTIKVDVQMRATTPLTGNCTSTVDGITKRTPPRTEQLPVVASATMNNLSLWQYRSSATSGWLTARVT